MKEQYKLIIQNVDKFYKLGNKSTFQALENINVKFKSGELVSIIGESGSGKSTLMNLIGGLDSDFKGDIIVDGLNLNQLGDKELDKYRKNKVGFVFQSFNLIPHLSILDNVTIALTLSNEKESVKIEKATKLLTRLGLEKQLKKKPTQLSGGQKQRVAIARALINEPDIILADEPTGALDSGTTMQILEILKEIADEGKLVIMVTHSQKVASTSSRIVEIADGKIVRDELNKNYKKQTSKQNQIIQDGKVAKQSTKQNLSLWSALRLSVHNMWASKTKNILMAFGVSVSILSMILMLAFGSGLTDYISGLANSYSNPNVVTITKRNELPEQYKRAAAVVDMLAPPQFTGDEEIDALRDDINKQLEDKNFDFRVNTSGEDKNVTYGFGMGGESALSMLTFMAPPSVTQSLPKISAKMLYTPEATEDVPLPEQISANIFYLYTTPAYYTSANMITKSEQSHLAGKNEAMFSYALATTLGLTEDECVGKKVEINIKIDDVEINEEVTVSAIVNTEMFDTELIMYVDYDYFAEIVDSSAKVAGSDFTLKPTTLYIHTDGQRTTDFIDAYIKTRSDEFQGALEAQLAGMFNQMLSTFSIALAIIAGISLVVAAIMILVVLYMSVTERTREIGVLKSIGARRKDIKRIFTAESFLIGLLSGIVGIILSLITGIIIMIVLKTLVGASILSFRWWYFVGALAISVIISMLSGLYPAAKAAKLDPVESLRHE